MPLLTKQGLIKTMGRCQIVPCSSSVHHVAEKTVQQLSSATASDTCITATVYPNSDTLHSFVKSIQPGPPLNADWRAVFSYDFDTLHFSHVVLNRQLQVIEFSNKRWTLEGDVTSRHFPYHDDNDRSLENGIGTLKRVNIGKLRRMIDCTTYKAIPLPQDCILTDQYVDSYEDKSKKPKDLAAFNIVRGLLYQVMLDRRSKEYLDDEKRSSESLSGSADDIIFEVDRNSLNKFYNMQMLSSRKERFLLDEHKARRLLRSLPREPVLPDNFLSSSSPCVNSQTLISALLRAVAFVTCFQVQPVQQLAALP